MSQPSTVVGVVSPGAMGSAVGSALRAGGARVVTTVAGRSRRTDALAGDLERLAGLDDVVVVADVVLSIVPPHAAQAVAGAVSAAARRTGARPLVADLNAIAPSTARALAEELQAAGLDAVDGSISGRPPAPLGTTTIYLSGARAGEIAALGAPGVEWSVVGAEPGAASAVKMSTASFYKGQAAVFAQALRAAEANGVLEPVLRDLSRSVPDLVERAPMLVQRLASVAGRYAGEMAEIATAQEAAGLTPTLFEAMARVYEELGGSALAAVSPERLDDTATLDDVLARLR